MKRRKAREVALSCLYSLELRPGPPLARLVESGSAKIDPELSEFAARLVAGVSERREYIDELIGRLAEKWDLGRVGLVEKNILRLAVYEMLLMEGIPTPPRVIIDEAIEITRKFGSEDAHRFVNGILDRAMKDYRPETSCARCKTP